MEHGSFPANDKLNLWSTEDLQKRVSRSLFLDFAIALIETADSKLLPQLIQSR